MTLTIPPVVSLLMLLSCLVGYGTAQFTNLAQVQTQKQEIEHLRQRTDDLQHDLSQERSHGARAVALAESDFRDLWRQLEQSNSELMRCWELLQDKTPSGKTPRPILASRRGLPHRSVKVQHKFSELRQRLKSNEQELLELRQATLAYRQARLKAEQELRFRCTPAGTPCIGPVTSGFGLRTHPIYGTGRFHNGCDFTVDYGTPISATGEGTVCHSDWLGGYGKVVEINHGYGLKTLYAHCDDLLVVKGQKVRRGQPIAHVGMTGLTSGPHCHYEVHLGGKPVDPAAYLKSAEPVLQWEQPRPSQPGLLQRIIALPAEFHANLEIGLPPS